MEVIIGLHFLAVLDKLPLRLVTPIIYKCLFRVYLVMPGEVLTSFQEVVFKHLGFVNGHPQQIQTISIYQTAAPGLMTDLPDVILSRLEIFMLR